MVSSWFSVEYFCRSVDIRTYAAAGDAASVRFERSVKRLVCLINRHLYPTVLYQPPPRRTRVTRLIVPNGRVECRFLKRASPFQKAAIQVTRTETAGFRVERHLSRLRLPLR